MPTDLDRSPIPDSSRSHLTPSTVKAVTQVIEKLIGHVFVALLLLAPLRAYATAVIVKDTISIAGQDRTYYHYVPETASTTSAPLLVLLHGSYQEGLYMTRLWTDFADREGIVLLAPDARRQDFWRTTVDGPDYIHAVVNAFLARQPVNTRRIYLFGQSGGAEYALTLGILESQYFAAVAVHAGAWRRSGEFDMISLAARKIPMKIMIGDRDEFFTMDSVRATQRALLGAGFPVEATIVEGQHHWFDDKTAPTIDAMAWDFLKSYSLDDEPRFVAYRLPAG